MSGVKFRPAIAGTPLICFLAMRLVGCGGVRNQSVPFTPKGPNAQVVVTTGDQVMLLQSQPAVTFGTGGMQNSQVITVSEATQYQTIDGFGASLPESSAWVIWNDLNSSQQSELIDRKSVV